MSTNATSRGVPAFVNASVKENGSILISYPKVLNHHLFYYVRVNISLITQAINMERIEKFFIVAVPGLDIVPRKQGHVG